MPKIRQLSEISTEMGEAQIEVLVEIVAAALQRNYPEVTVEIIENLLDLGNSGPVLNAVLTGSGLRRTRPSGEARAPESNSGAVPPVVGIAGDISTASSPLPADTAIP